MTIAEQFRDEGRQQGMQQGMQQGVQQQKIEFAKRLLVKMRDLEMIAELADLPLEEVIKLNKSFIN